MFVTGWEVGYVCITGADPHWGKAWQCRETVVTSSVLFGKFHTYLFGRPFVLYSDDEPLSKIQLKNPGLHHR